MTEKREKLKGQQYACPRDRKLPINDAAHVRNAMARFDQVESKFCHPATARRRILAAARKFGIDVSELSNTSRAQQRKVSPILQNSSESPIFLSIER
jgi:hypothetical protein